MLTDRNFDTSNLQDTSLINTKEHINFELKHKLTNQTLKVHYHDDGKIGINHLKCIMNNLNETKHVLIIHKDDLTSFAKQYILSNNEICFETYFPKELVNNITKHELVPKHVCLSHTEKIQFLADFKIKEINVPRILKSDPIARYYGCTRGTLMKIYRNDDNINSITYRIVV